eukprot:COSAG01_NODE_4693_length_4808_cov_6.865152_1_plen_166_part_00
MPRTIAFLLMPGMLLSVGAAPAGAGTAASAPRTATAPDAATRQEAQVLGEVLGRLRSLEVETARLAEAQRAAEARHTAAVAGLERRVGDLEAERERKRDTAGEEGFKQSSGEHPPRRLQAPPTRGERQRQQSRHRSHPGDLAISLPFGAQPVSGRHTTQTRRQAH